MMKKQWTNSKGVVLYIFIVLVVLSIDIFFVYAYFSHVQNFLTQHNKNIKAEAGIIFFGDYNEQNTDLGPDSKLRAHLAIKLYKEGRINKIICVGGYSGRYWRGKPHYMKNYLVKHGVPQNIVFYDSLSFNTITNWYEAKKIIKNQNISNIVVISAPMHVYRIARMIRDHELQISTYEYVPENFNDYLRIYRDIHHEWVSHFLSLALKDDVRNRMVHFYRTLKTEVDQLI